MSRLHRFGAIVTPGPIAHIVLDTYTKHRFDGELEICVTPELGSVEEIEWYGQHLIADVKAAVEEAKARFVDQQNSSFDPFS